MPLTAIPTKLPALLILAAVCACGRAHGQGHRATVRFRCVDPFGGSTEGYAHIRNFRVDSFKDSHGKNWAYRFKGGLADGIPYGTYQVSARLEINLTEYSERIEVYAPSVLVNAAFGMSAMEVGGPVGTVLAGHVDGMAVSEGEGWCRLSGVYLRAQYDTALQKNGSFDFGYVDVGSYVVTCANGSRLQLSEPLQVTGGMEPITLHTGPPSAK